MSGTRLRSPVVLTLVARVCSASAPVISDAQAPARQPSVTTDVVYGHKDGLALTFDVHRPAQPNGAGVIAIVRQLSNEYPVARDRVWTWAHELNPDDCGSTQTIVSAPSPVR
jgi:hypothetical protein